MNNTPGPWCVTIDSEPNAMVHVARLLSEKTDDPLFTVGRASSDEDVANAALAAAAPELYAALSRIVRAHESGNNGSVMGEAILCQEFAARAKAALNKAGGY